MAVSPVDVRAHIEPIAAQFAEIENEYLASIAISLKRIADALDYGDDDTNLAEMVAEIAMNTRSIGQ